jgi:hypothetical protein
MSVVSYGCKSRYKEKFRLTILFVIAADPKQRCLMLICIIYVFIVGDDVKLLLQVVVHKQAVAFLTYRICLPLPSAQNNAVIVPKLNICLI